MFSSAWRRMGISRNAGPLTTRSGARQLQTQLPSGGGCIPRRCRLSVPHLSNHRRAGARRGCRRHQTVLILLIENARDSSTDQLRTLRNPN
jgi:hypothetical protein